MNKVIAFECTPEHNQPVEFNIFGEEKERYGRYDRKLNIIVCQYVYVDYPRVEYWKPVEEKLSKIFFGNKETDDPIINCLCAKELSNVILNSDKEKIKLLHENEIKKKGFVVVGSVVAILSEGKLKYYDVFELTYSWFNSSNDAFFEMYGFSWIPTAKLRDYYFVNFDTTMIDSNSNTVNRSEFENTNSDCLSINLFENELAKKQVNEIFYKNSAKNVMKNGW